MKKISSAGGFAPKTPMRPAAGGFALTSPLAYRGWGLRPQTPKIAPQLRISGCPPEPDSQDKEVDDYANILGLPYFGKPSRKFASQLSTLL